MTTERFDHVVIGLGGLGSAAAYQLARRGHRVLGLERFELGHVRGASHDSSRILRNSYHTPAYVRLTREAYADWADLERSSGQTLVTRTGGLDLFPPDPAIPSIDYTRSMDEVGVPYEALDGEQVMARWPQLRLPSGTLALYQDNAAIVPAGRTVAVLHEQA
ncbi:MAG TPA: FAD-dependent oxidoreductase, partial [Nocardioides sp.]|nr:FAD-dependent oxidoreductase [Nocardioides sp.]